MTGSRWDVGHHAGGYVDEHGFYVPLGNAEEHEWEHYAHEAWLESERKLSAKGWNPDKASRVLAGKTRSGRRARKRKPSTASPPRREKPDLEALLPDRPPPAPHVVRLRGWAIGLSGVFLVLVGLATNFQWSPFSPLLWWVGGGLVLTGAIVLGCSRPGTRLRSTGRNLAVLGILSVVIGFFSPIAFLTEGWGEQSLYPDDTVTLTPGHDYSVYAPRLKQPSSSETCTVTPQSGGEAESIPLQPGSSYQDYQVLRTVKTFRVSSYGTYKVRCGGGISEYVGPHHRAAAVEAGYRVDDLDNVWAILVAVSGISEFLVGVPLYAIGKIAEFVRRRRGRKELLAAAENPSVDGTVAAGGSGR